jgi:DNA-binding transcriptional regulator YhcF (GntR family)
VLTNALAMAEGVSRRTKWNALIELERLGLVRVERRSRKSPRLHLLHLPRHQN